MLQDRKVLSSDPRLEHFLVMQTLNQENRKEKLRKVGLVTFSKVGPTPQFHLSKPVLSTLTREYPPYTLPASA